MTDDRAFKRAIRRRMEQTGEKYTEARRALIEEATGDPLAALADRRAATCAIDRALRNEADARVVAVQIEIDNFARLKETYGNERARDLLVRVAGLLRDHTPEAGVLARLSDAAFLVVLPHYGLSEALPFAEWLQASIEQPQVTALKRSRGPQPAVTATFGLASVPDNAADAPGLLSAAEEDLQRAERSGRDRLGARSGEWVTRDAVTGLANRRLFERELDRTRELHAYSDAPVGLVMLDIDDFKQVNDTYGHEQGDEVLKAIAGALDAHVRDRGLAARFGGEEFVVLLPGTDQSGAHDVAEDVRHAIEQLRIPQPDGAVDLQVTASLGVVSIPESADTASHLLYAADLALYQAKRAGKNRVERGWHEASKGPGGAFARFAPEAMKVMMFAQQEGRRFDHGHIGSEHILLGLLSDEEGVAAQLLLPLDITADRVRAELLNTRGQGAGTPTSPPFTSNAKTVIELSLTAANQLEAQTVRPEHLLLGLVRRGKGAATDILRNLEAEPSLLEKRLRAQLDDHRQEDDAPG